MDYDTMTGALPMDPRYPVSITFPDSKAFHPSELQCRSASTPTLCPPNPHLSPAPRKGMEELWRLVGIKNPNRKIRPCQGLSSKHGHAQYPTVSWTGGQWSKSKSSLYFLSERAVAPHGNESRHGLKAGYQSCPVRSSKYPWTRLPISNAPIIMKITSITIDQNKEDRKHWPPVFKHLQHSIFHIVKGSAKYPRYKRRPRGV